MTGPAPGDAGSSSGTSSTMCTQRGSGRESAIASLHLDEVVGRGERGDLLDDAARERLRGQSDVLQDGGTLGVVEELLRDAEDADRRGDALLVEGLEQDRPAAAD